MSSYTRRIVVALVVLVLAGVVPGMAQEQQFTKVDNPYQGEVPFTLGKPSAPNVEIAGVRWLAVELVPATNDLVSGRRIRTTVELTFENTMAGRAKVLVVLLFEDAEGNGLDRIELKQVSVPGGKKKVFRQKVKLQADLLKSTAKLYLFAEVK
ncbi:MAG TPA: hypothetical protein ENK19_02165 [Acidobacteria bacterium]|nr:hypothetical protein [Acidobacteriota bacterium]